MYIVQLKKYIFFSSLKFFMAPYLLRIVNNLLESLIVIKITKLFYC